MKLSGFIEWYANHPRLDQCLHFFANDKPGSIQIGGLAGSSLSFLLAALHQKSSFPVVVVFNDREEASYAYTDLKGICGEENILFFPSSYKRSARFKQVENSNIVARTEVLARIHENQGPFVMVTYPEAVSERVVSLDHLKQNTLHLNRGEKVSPDFIVDVLNEYVFERVDFVYEPGQYSVRGSIIDIFSFAAGKPYRIDFFGNEVESIRIFEPESQLSVSQLEHIAIVPDLKQKLVDRKAISLLDFLPGSTVLGFKNLTYVKDVLDEIFQKPGFSISADEEALGYVNLPVEQRLITGDVLIDKLKKFKMMEFCSQPFFKPDTKLEFSISLQPAFNKNFQLLSQKMIENQESGYKNFIFSESEQQITRLQNIFAEISPGLGFSPVMPTIHEGFIDHELLLCCYTDHQIFDRYHKYQVREIAGSDALTIKELTSLQPGDYVVHIDHGIGKFAGLQKIEQNGKTQEAVKLVYRDNDFLFVSIHSLHRISKYKGKEGIAPKVHKLGSQVWQNLKQSTKRKVKDIARDLIKLYAQRKMQKGFMFSPDSYLTKELEASFIYEDTPDQTKSTRDVKQDMEANYPMDRLICGDVGFGKTEIAIRAAFKAAVDGKQVAVLVPTTILALQHYKTFSERLKQLPCSVEYISRLRPSKEIKKTLKKVEEGKTEILIGTHRLLGEDIKFKDLGLLIIDEEQKFGVAAKEKLKKLKLNVDTLTMTATPIPRTLQFSLLGARDLSIINTPPPNRHPIITELHVFNEDIIREAITYEFERDGQVFFIHNRVQNIQEVCDLVRKICPFAKVVVGHGQMKGDELEEIMIDFINGAFDVLVATTIIESGLDIPNANTILINDAQNFGLSDLHQLRGRVGRSNRKAFCYLLAPPLSVLSSDARRRLKAIEDFSALGSGFNISLQDLDIRGAGNMLGGEQSGFIADIGFETYQRILDEAIQELHNEEMPDADEGSYKEASAYLAHSFVNDCYIDTDLEILFPDSYIGSATERVKLYRELDGIENEENLQLFAKNLADRFGVIPQQSLDLLEVVRIRWDAMRFGFEKVVIKNGKMLAYFVSGSNTMYFQSDIFGKVLKYIQSNAGKCQLVEKNEKLMLSVEPIKMLKDVSDFFSKMAKTV